MLMERAVLLATVPVGGIPEGYERVYLGNEFCERNLPTPKELTRGLEAAKDASVPLTLVTPYLTDTGLSKVRKLLDILPSGSEVVFNDWGLLASLNDHVPIMGRILTYQRRGPRLINVIERLPEEAQAYLRDSPLSQESYRQFLHERGVTRAEFDNPLQGIGFSLSEDKAPLKGSIYTPWVYVTTTRLCLSRACTKPEARDELGILPCERECRDLAFTLTHKSMPLPLLLRGNTVFYRNEKTPRDLGDRGFDRMVVQPAPPPCSSVAEGRKGFPKGIED